MVSSEPRPRNLRTDPAEYSPVVATAAFLLGDRATCITGASVDVAGGRRRYL